MNMVTPANPQSVETSIARNELILNQVRDSALNLLVVQGQDSSFNSTAHKTATGMRVDTVNNKTGTSSSFLIEGRADRPGLDLSAILPDTAINANLKVTSIDGQGRKVSEQDQFKMSSMPWDRTDQSNISMKRLDQSGRQIQFYEPARSEAQRELDSNGQPIRLARPAGNSPNTFMENPFNPGNNRMESDFIIHDARLGKDLSYNQTRERFGNSWEYRSVVRDMGGKVLGIVKQDFKLDENGDITDVHTSARKPMQLKK